MSARSYDLHGGTEFEELAERYRRELQIHCYRITGSVQDTEDLVQETLLAGISGCRGRCLSIWATTVRDQGARPNRKRSTTMARYLLSTHTIDGEERPPMTDDEMEQFMTRIGALEEEMRSAGA